MKRRDEPDVLAERDATGRVDRSEAVETLAALSRSPSRFRILVRLLDEPATTTELAEELPVSRRTVTRALETLREEGFVVEDCRTYRPTTIAEIVGPDLRRVVDRLDRSDELATFVEHVPDGALGPDPAAVEGDVTVMDSTQPHAPGERVIELLDGADEIAVLAPVVTATYLDALREQVVHRGASAEVIVTGAVRDRLCKPLLTAVRPAVAQHDAALYAHDGDTPIGVVLVDDAVAVGAFDEDGTLRALLEATTPAVEEWGRGVYEEYRTAAEPMID